VASRAGSCWNTITALSAKTEAGAANFVRVSSSAPPGRPPVTTHAAIEQAAFALFERQGFDETTMEDIAAALGVGRRSLFRYYPSKNDILWGQFDDSLHGFEQTFAALPRRTPLHLAIRDAVIAFNRLDEAAIPQHRQRMRLLLGTPALLAHSELRYAAWRAVVAEYVAGRLRCSPTDLTPTLAGRAALAIALTAYEQWLRDDTLALPDLIAETAGALAAIFAAPAAKARRR
jgi:mycofactocin system transcriptional regulator